MTTTWLDELTDQDFEYLGRGVVAMHQKVAELNHGKAELGGPSWFVGEQVCVSMELWEVLEAAWHDRLDALIREKALEIWETRQEMARKA